MFKGACGIRDLLKSNLISIVSDDVGSFVSSFDYS